MRGENQAKLNFDKYRQKVTYGCGIVKKDRNGCKQIHTILFLDEQIRQLRQIILDVNSKFKTISTRALILF